MLDKADVDSGIASAMDRNQRREERSGGGVAKTIFAACEKPPWRTASTNALRRLNSITHSSMDPGKVDPFIYDMLHCSIQRLHGRTDTAMTFVDTLLQPLRRGGILQAGPLFVFWFAGEAPGGVHVPLPLQREGPKQTSVNACSWPGPAFALNAR